MGKLVIISLVLIVVILSAVLISVRERSENSIDSFALRSTQRDAELLANYAVQYGIKLLNDGYEPYTDTTIKEVIDNSNTYTKTFPAPPDVNAFEVKEGFVNSLTYTYDDSMNIMLDALVTYNSNNNSVNSVTRAILELPASDSINIGNIPNALSAKGPIEIQGKPSSKKGIHGDVASEDEIIYQNKNAGIDGNEKNESFPPFEEIFGITLQEMQALADYVGVNPPDLDGITFITGDAHFASNGSYSGILIIDGDLKITGTIDFNGIIWATGKITGLGNGYIFGAVFAAGIDLTETGGSFLLEYDENLSGSTFTSTSSSGNYKILAIYKDYRN